MRLGPENLKHPGTAVLLSVSPNAIVWTPSPAISEPQGRL